MNKLGRQAAIPSSNTNNEICTFLDGHLRRCLGLPPDTPVHVLYAIAGEFPADGRADLLTDRGIIKLLLIENNTFNKLVAEAPFMDTSYSSYYFKFKMLIDQIAIPKSGLATTKFITDLGLFDTFGQKTEIPRLIVHSVFGAKIEPHKREKFHIFATDASVDGGKSGCAFFDLDRDMIEEFYIDQAFSSMSAELIPILKAVE